MTRHLGAGGEAYVALQWGSGVSQRQIARDLGMTGSAICCAINRFLLKFSDAPRNSGDYAYGRITAQTEERRALVAAAVQRFRETLP